LFCIDFTEFRLQAPVWIDAPASLEAKLIEKAERILAAAMVMLGLCAMTALAQDHDHGGHEAAAPAAAPATADGRTASPKGAEVYFHYPVDGIRVPQRFTVQIGLRAMGIAPAGIVKPLTGHHHLLVDAKDADDTDLNQPIPSDYNHVHLGNGQTEVVLTLPPGRHTLQLLMGDHAHIPHVPPVMSEKITIYVR
jgi:hypothetical protein